MSRDGRQDDVVLEPTPSPGGPLATALVTHRAALGAMIRAGYHLTPPKKCRS